MKSNDFREGILPHVGTLTPWIQLWNDEMRGGKRGLEVLVHMRSLVLGTLPPAVPGSPQLHVRDSWALRTKWSIPQESQRDGNVQELPPNCCRNIRKILLCTSKGVKLWSRRQTAALFPQAMASKHLICLIFNGLSPSCSLPPLLGSAA